MYKRTEYQVIKERLEEPRKFFRLYAIALQNSSAILFRLTQSARLMWRFPAS
jgi:hypothetical protein